MRVPRSGSMRAEVSDEGKEVAQTPVEALVPALVRRHLGLGERFERHPLEGEQRVGLVQHRRSRRRYRSGEAPM